MEKSRALSKQIERAFFVIGFIYARINGNDYRALRHIDGLQVEALDKDAEVTDEIRDCFTFLEYKLCQR